LYIVQQNKSVLFVLQ